MKIRTDFVTNSSSSSYLTIHVKSDRLQELLGLDLEELNESIEQAIFNCKSLDEEAEFPFAEDDPHQTILGYLLDLLTWGGQIEEGTNASDLSDADLQVVEINHAEFQDSGFGPFEYVRTDGKKKMTIRVEDIYDKKAYKEEDISEMKFYFVGAADEFRKQEEMIEYSLSRILRKFANLSFRSFLSFYRVFLF